MPPLWRTLPWLTDINIFLHRLEIELTDTATTDRRSYCYLLVDTVELDRSAKNEDVKPSAEVGWVSSDSDNVKINKIKC